MRIARIVLLVIGLLYLLNAIKSTGGNMQHITGKSSMMFLSSFLMMTGFAWLSLRRPFIFLLIPTVIFAIMFGLFVMSTLPILTESLMSLAIVAIQFFMLFLLISGVFAARAYQRFKAFVAKN